MLEQHQDVLTRHFRGQREETEDTSDPPPMDMSDQATREEVMTFRDSRIERDRHQLQAIDAALARIDDGSYGICLECAQPIDGARLRVSPEAELCVACAEDREPPHTRHRGPTL